MFYDGRLTCTFNSPIDGRHQDGVDVAYADGHAKLQKARRNAAGQWVVAGGPYDGRLELWGLVNDQGQYGGCP